MREPFSTLKSGCVVGLYAVLVLASPLAMAQSGHGTDKMDHAGMDHSKMAHGGTDHGSMAKGSVRAEATVESLFKDFMHYARIGRFTASRSFAKSLLDHPDLDPVALMKIANRNPKNLENLITIIKNSTIGDEARRVLDLIEEGEHLERQNPERIRENIKLLGGNPQQEFFARKRLADSGEYAIPQLVQVLHDPTKKNLWSRVATALPQIGKAAVNPLVISLAANDEHVRQSVIGALAEIGYPQAIPYLLQVVRRDDVSRESRQAAAVAIDRIQEITGRTFPGEPHELFFYLGEAYYNEDAAFRADPRINTANVWYWDAQEQALSRVVVPTKIFGQVMAMRCAEEALLLKNDFTEANALWLSSNVRRESRLAMNVESGDPKEEGEVDATRVPEFPRALYFTQAAGPRYAHLVLERAVADNDASVALGAIRALRTTAGEASLIGTEDYKQPLVQALRFPDLVVRMRAALALGAALPKSQFSGSQLVMPVLKRSLTQTGRQELMVVDPDEQNANRVVEALRDDHDTLGGGSFYSTLERVRVEFQVLSGVFVASDVSEPGLPAALTEFRREFVFSKTPVVVLAKPGQRALADELAKADRYVEVVDAVADADTLLAAFQRVRERTGQTPLSADLGLSLAMETTAVLRDMAIDGRTIFDVTEAEPALIAALASDQEPLQIAAADVLALLDRPTAQRSIAHVALEADHTVTLRLAAFAALAESAKRNGNLLEDAQVTELVRFARDESDMVLREAASRTLGAVNLATNQASDIIRKYYGG